jgi:hypothetical protein
MVPNIVANNRADFLLAQTQTNSISRTMARLAFRPLSKLNTLMAKSCW